MKIGKIVFLKTDIEQKERVVTGIMQRPNGVFLYYLSLECNETCHYDIEISNEKDILKQLDINTNFNFDN
jgi:hypothetical protein